MPISALVLTLEPAFTAAVHDWLLEDPRITTGELTGAHLPIAAETASLEEGEDLCAELARTPGVVFVDVVSVDFSDLEAP
jgi:hypothetical protein